MSRYSFLKLCLLVAMVFCYGNGYAQTDDRIELIRANFKYINSSLDKFDKKVIELPSELSESTEGGELVAYAESGKLRKLVLGNYSESGKVIIEYYFTENELFFCFVQKSTYNVPFTVDEERAKEMGLDEWFDEEKTEVEENRYYYHDGLLIRWIDEDGNRVDSTSREFREKEVAVKQSLKSLVGMIKKQAGG